MTVATHVFNTGTGDVPLHQASRAQEASTLTANWVQAVDAGVGHTIVLHGAEQQPQHSQIEAPKQYSLKH